MVTMFDPARISPEFSWFCSEVYDVGDESWRIMETLLLSRPVTFGDFLRAMLAVVIKEFVFRQDLRGESLLKYRTKKV